jgi:ParB-like chromosome segregation protein Spo0J
MKVECAYDELVNIEKLVPNPRNPNAHPQKQVDLLAKIIDTQGWRAPITISKRSGFIVRGHARLEAARKLGYDKCPVDFQDYGSEAEEWADLVADNRITELAETNFPRLKDILEELDTGAFDMDLTGFDDKALGELMTQFHIEPNQPELDENIKTENECPKCGYKW